jgi:Holliday junction DNA helicase RuvA
MFNYIRGQLVNKEADRAVVDIHGLGYEIHISFKTFQALGELDSDVYLYIHPYYREDMQKLFGFVTEKERELFKLMIAISGIGPKVAMAALSSISVEDFQKIVAHQDVVGLTRVPGIGRKGAERLIMEMKDKIKVDKPPLMEAVSPVTDDVLMALTSLGYKDVQARKALQSIQNEGLSFQELMKACLGVV